MQRRFAYARWNQSRQKKAKPILPLAAGDRPDPDRRDEISVSYTHLDVYKRQYLTQVNGYQTVCQGCFAPFPYMQPTDPRFSAVTQLATGENSHYNGPVSYTHLLHWDDAAGKFTHEGAEAWTGPDNAVVEVVKR